MTGMANDFVRDAKFGPRTVPVSAEFFVNGAFIQEYVTFHLRNLIFETQISI